MHDSYFQAVLVSFCSSQSSGSSDSASVASSHSNGASPLRLADMERAINDLKDGFADSMYFL